MKRAGNFIARQCELILEEKQRSVVFAVVLSILPFVSWLSVALVTLITLRKGARYGFDLLLPALVFHSVPLMMLVPLSSALINAFVAYLPCYLAALSLRKTENWQIVSGVFLIQAFLACLFFQVFLPDFIVEQFSQFKIVLAQYYELVDAGLEGMNSLFPAQLFFGVQILSVVISSLTSLMFARSIQAKLFLPDGFRNELKTFRSGKLSFLVFLAISLGAYYEIPLAVNMLPLVVCYFLVSGVGLAYSVCSRKRQLRVFILLMLLILLKPTFVLSVYIILGALDSVFNFRMYLPSSMRESI